GRLQRVRDALAVVGRDRGTFDALDVRRRPRNERGLLQSVDLRAVEAAREERELVRCDVETVCIRTDQRLVADARAAWVRGRYVRAVVRDIDGREVPIGRVHGRRAGLARRDPDREGRYERAGRRVLPDREYRHEE